MEHGRFSLELRGPPKGNHLRLTGYANMSDLKSQGNALVKGMLNSQHPENYVDQSVIIYDYIQFAYASQAYSLRLQTLR